MTAAPPHCLHCWGELDCNTHPTITILQVQSLRRRYKGLISKEKSLSGISQAAIMISGRERRRRRPIARQGGRGKASHINRSRSRAHLVAIIISFLPFNSAVKYQTKQHQSGTNDFSYIIAWLTRASHIPSKHGISPSLSSVARSVTTAACSEPP